MVDPLHPNVHLSEHFRKLRTRDPGPGFEIMVHPLTGKPALFVGCDLAYVMAVGAAPPPAPMEQVTICMIAQMPGGFEMRQYVKMDRATSLSFANTLIKCAETLPGPVPDPIPEKRS